MLALIYKMPSYTKESILLLSQQEMIDLIMKQQEIIASSKSGKTEPKKPECKLPECKLPKKKKTKNIKGHIYFKSGAENLTTKQMIDRSYKKMIVRIMKEHEEEFRKILSIEKDVEFIYDKKQETTQDGINIEGVPEFNSCEKDKYSSNPKTTYYFENEENYKEFLLLLEDKCSIRNKTIWFPYSPKKEEQVSNSPYSSDCKETDFPIYIPSYKRYDTLYTIKALEKLGISNYKVVIRPTENEEKNYRQYMEKQGIKNIDEKIYVMSEEQMEFEKSGGNNNSIIPRRIIWYDAVKRGYKAHWVLDDNIKGFSRRIEGKKIPFENTSFPFRFVEEMLYRYPNVMQGAIQYEHLCPAAGNRSLVILNSRAYSCMLNRHFTEEQDKQIGGHWRGSYNEDTDLSLRILKAGYPTMTFQNILCNKQSTSSVKGGNNVSAYIEDGFKKKAEELYNNHPDCVKIVTKYNRIHHQVDYTKFRNNKLEENIGYKLNLPELYC